MKENIPWFRPELAGTEETFLREVLDSVYLNDGSMSRQLETSIAKRIGVAHAVAVTSGTAAIALALMACGIGPGDEVIVPDLTFIATANAVRLAGADVKLVDVEPRYLTIDVDLVRQAIGPKTRAVVSVDVNGRSCDYTVLEKLCSEHGLALICDAAEALGSRSGGRYLGTFGQAGCFSFSANKTITSGQGGMIVTDDPKIFKRLIELKDQGRRVQGSGGDDLHPVMGFNFKFTNLQAAVVLAQLEKFEERLAKAEQREGWYREALADCPFIRFPEMRDGEILQWTDILSPRRKQIISALNEIGAGTRSFWFPLHRQEPYRESDSGFPHTIKLSTEGLWLPSYFSLEQNEVDQVASAIIAALGA